MNGARERQMEESTRGPRSHALLCAVIAAAGLLPLPVVAYVGPGAGLSALGSLLALLAAIVVAIAGFLWYPIKRLFGRRRTSAPVESNEASGASPPATGDRRDDEKS
jgi:hypothetical protein